MEELIISVVINVIITMLCCSYVVKKHIDQIDEDFKKHYELIYNDVAQLVTNRLLQKNSQR